MRVVSVWQLGDKGIRMSKSGCSNAIGIASIKASVANIVYYACTKQANILQNGCNSMAQVTFANITNIDSVIQDLTISNVIKTRKKIGDSGFASSSGTYKRNFLTRVRIPRYIVQNSFRRLVAKRNVFKANISPNKRVHAVFRANRVFLGICARIAA